MSRSSVLDFCKKLDDTLASKGSTQLYRELVADKRVHVFKFNAKDMASQTKIELESTKNKLVLTQSDRKIINKLAKEMKNRLDKSLSKLAAKSTGVRYKSTTNTISFKFDSSVGSQRVITLGRSQRKIYPDNIFAKVKIAYQPALKIFFKHLQNHLKSTVEVNPETGRVRNRSLRTKSGKTAQAAGRYFNAGHEKGSGIFETFLRDSFDSIANSSNLDSVVTQSDLQNTMGVKSLLTVIRDDKKDTHTITIESDYLNKRGKEGGADVKSVKAQLRKELKAAIKKLEKSVDVGVGLSNLQGSDSITTKKKKKLRESYVEPFKKLKHKNIIIDAKNVKTDSKSSSNSLKKVSTSKKGTSASRLGVGVKAVTVLRGSKSSKRQSSRQSFDPLAIVTAINKELPATVRQNMGAPALENQTGRFAESVRVTDIMQTRKGFPSIGYTYQRNPYEVFETGSGTRFADPDRDPRKIIDQSIREIAAQFMMGRFYTRRQ